MPQPSFWEEIESYAVNTIAQPRRRRPVSEDMPQVRSTAAAANLRSNHAMTRVDRFHERAWRRIKKAWPTCTTVKFIIRYKQRLIAADTVEYAWTLFMI